jgi:outer membrane PBP1 activator LpoA protein
MHLGNLSGATSTLQRVASGGNSPQQEAAFYYLAQIALARNDAALARQYLDRTVALHGEFEQRARRQSAALASVAGKR